MSRAQPALFALDAGDPGEPDALLDAAQTTIDALRAQNAIRDWHELDCQIVIDLARAIGQHRGIAKSQLFGALLQARSRLPEPQATEQALELVQVEADRELSWIRAHSDPADIQDAEIIEPVH